ncbi:MAG TPA: M24 family metallopeptidase, partial [Bdellovibrionota bacterium]|nr:M24 family metallopeptidase [Bdellovibrionota bacterium]
MSSIGAILSKIPTSSRRVPRVEDLEGFRDAQRLAYDAALATAAAMREGWTERQAAAHMETYLRDRGVKAFFHKPLAWFGDRSRFHRFRTYGYFFPTERALRPDDVVILDVAPVVGGYAGDIGYTCSLTEQPRLRKAENFLREIRAEIPRLFADPKLSPSDIWAAVDRRVVEAGYQNCHAKYPFRVLGHRLYRIPFEGLPGLLFPFTLHTYGAFLGHGLFPELLGPRHAGAKTGIWAVEPH